MSTFDNPHYPDATPFPTHPQMPPIRRKQPASSKASKAASITASKAASSKASKARVRIFSLMFLRMPLVDHSIVAPLHKVRPDIYTKI